MWGYEMHDGSWGGMFFWILFFLLFVALVIGLLIYFMRKNTSAGGQGTTSSSATNLLKERYARGEISTEEYKERLRELEGYNSEK